LEPVISHPSFK